MASKPHFLAVRPSSGGRGLVCAATITERNGSWNWLWQPWVRKPPLWWIGKAYDEADPYARRFFQIAREHPNLCATKVPCRTAPNSPPLIREGPGLSFC